MTESGNSVRRRVLGGEKDQPKGSVAFKDLTEEEAVALASRGWIKHFVVSLTVALTVGVIIVLLIPSPIKPVPITGLSTPPQFSGPLAPNKILTYTEKIYRNKLMGPESLVVDGDHIYTGTADGWVNHLYAGEVQRIARFGKEPCGGYENENTCGRPLGMRLDKDGTLLVADAYYGLFRVNVVTGDYETLYSSSTPINGKTSKLVNDLDIGPDGIVYFTDSSTKWTRNQFPNILLEGVGNGRLLQYNPTTNETSQVMGGLIFANGVQLTRDKSAVLVTETCRARIMKFDLKTKKVSVWSDNLPGLPDNIRYSRSSGSYWVGLALVRQAGKLSLLDTLADRPFLRELLGKFMSINMLFTLKKFSSTDVKTLAIELNEQGEIISSIQDPTGETVEAVSEISDENGIIHFGSYHAPYLGRLFKKRIPGLH